MGKFVEFFFDFLEGTPWFRAASVEHPNVRKQLLVEFCRQYADVVPVAFTVEANELKNDKIWRDGDWIVSGALSKAGSKALQFVKVAMVVLLDPKTKSQSRHYMNACSFHAEEGICLRLHVLES